MSIDIERLKHDLEYWYSEAPVGATHYGPGELDDCPWMMAIQGRSGRAWTAWDGRAWMPMAIAGDYEDVLIPRPAPAWDGSGLPPVGVECEFSFMGYDKWFVCKPMHYGSYAVFLKSHKEDASGIKEYSIPLDDIKFRPLKTEKERVVEAATEFFTRRGFCPNKHDLGAAYDAGLLKMPEKDYD